MHDLTVGAGSTVGGSFTVLTVAGTLTTTGVLIAGNIGFAPGSQIAGSRSMRMTSTSTTNPTTLQVNGNVSFDKLILGSINVTGGGTLTLTGTGSTWGAATVHLPVTIAPGGDLYLGATTIAGNLTVPAGASLHTAGYAIEGTVTNSSTVDSRNNSNAGGTGKIINQAGGTFLAGSADLLRHSTFGSAVTSASLGHSATTGNSRPASP